MAVTGLGLAGVINSAAVIRRWGDDRPIRLSLAAILAVRELTEWYAATVQDQRVLPLHLCDLALFALVGALVGGPSWLGELACFWGLSGSLQAILTPDLARGFPSYRWITFFLGHVLVVVGAAYLLARGMARLTWRSVWRSWLITNVYVLAAGVVNWRHGTNFGYLARKPSHPSLLDYLGPWPWYVVGMELIGVGLFAVCVGVSRWVERRAGLTGRHEQETACPSR